MMKIRQKLIFDGFYHGGCALQLIFKLLQKLPGPAVNREFFPAYICFASCRITDKDAGLARARIIVRVPNILYYGYKLFFTKSLLIK